MNTAIKFIIFLMVIAADVVISVGAYQASTKPFELMESQDHMIVAFCLLLNVFLVAIVNELTNDKSDDNEPTDADLSKTGYNTAEA